MALGSPESIVGSHESIVIVLHFEIMIYWSKGVNNEGWKGVVSATRTSLCNNECLVVLPSKRLILRRDLTI